MKNVSIISCFLFILCALTAGLNAQTKKPKKVKKTTTVVTAAPQPNPEPQAETPVKRNERPASEITSTDARSNSGTAIQPTYFYEFTRPGFTYSRILIEHDDTGKGKISFLKDGFDELVTDPIDLSTATLAKINDTLTALNFLDSNENYQHERDFSNLGNVSITVKRSGRERTAKYNWTENKNAKLLMNVYRYISNEYTWRFEMSVARQNQPLQTPGLMDALDSYLRRGEFSDPPHLLPFLTELSTDERLPLMARNHAAKLIQQIAKPRNN